VQEKKGGNDKIVSGVGGSGGAWASIRGWGGKEKGPKIVPIAAVSAPQLARRTFRIARVSGEERGASGVEGLGQPVVCRVVGKGAAVSARRKGKKRRWLFSFGQGRKGGHL